MDNLIVFLGFTISFGLSLFMLYLRMKNWFVPIAKTTIALSLAFIGILGFVQSNTNDYIFLFYSMLIPFVYYLVDKIFKHLSLKFQGRDFYLFLRSSSDLDDLDKKFKTLDVIFSLTIFFLLIGLSFFGAVLFGKDGFYNEWINN